MPPASRSPGAPASARAAGQRWHSVFRTGATVLGLAATLLVVARIGYWRMFRGFSAYDDEGCMLLTIKSFMAGHPLYDEVFSMYGPLPVLLKAAFFATSGLAIGHDLGRLIALGYWLLAAAVCGIAAWRLTHTPIVGWAAGLVVFVGLGKIVLDPGHPQDLCAVLVSIAVLLATFVGQSYRRNAAVLAALGIIAGCLAMTKINVFVFMMMALSGAVLAFLRRTLLVRGLIALYALALLLLPYVLMRGLINQPATWSFASHSMLSLIAVLMLGFGRPARVLFEWKQCASIGAGILGAAGAIAGVVLVSGTTPFGLLDGVLLIPLKAGVRFVSVSPAYLGRWPIPVAFIVVALLWLAAERTGAALRTVPALLSAAVRIAYVGHFLPWDGDVQHVSYGTLSAFGMPAAVLLLIPHAPLVRGNGDIFGRLFLALLAMTETLSSYPVAGSQEAFATFLTMLTLVIVLADGCRDLATVHGRWAGQPIWRAGRLAHAGVIIIILQLARTEATRAEASYLHGTSLGLPGAEAIRIDSARVTQLHSLTAHLRSLPDTFFTMPGMYSLYFWSGRESPTTLNLTNWMYMLDDDQQDRIVSQLAARPDLRVVYNAHLVGFWMKGKPLPETSPLVHYIDTNFTPAAQVGAIEIWNRKSKAAPQLPRVF